MDKRLFTPLNLAQFNNINEPKFVEYYDIKCPYKEQSILRMLIYDHNRGWAIPKQIQWLDKYIHICKSFQTLLKINHPFCYITVRHNYYSNNNDIWHVDGYSERITHLPEQNYICANTRATQVCLTPIKFPIDFDPLKHNIHSYINKILIDLDDGIKILETNAIYMIDPYVIHRKPHNADYINGRTFIRLSFTPIEIADVNNTINPLLPTNYTYDGVKEFRNNLIDF